MTTIRLQLDDATYDLLRQKAADAGMTPEEYLAARAREAVTSPKPAPASQDGSDIIGLFADEPELVEEVLANIMRWREERNRMLMEGPFRFDPGHP